MLISSVSSRTAEVLPNDSVLLRTLLINRPALTAFSSFRVKVLKKSLIKMNRVINLTVLAILVGLASSQTPSPCGVEINVDYLYNDITNQFVASAGACQELCSAYPACQTWSYVVVTNACWLKSANRANRVDSPGRKFSYFLKMIGT